MVERDPKQQPEQDPATDDESEGVDFERVKQTIGFVLRAARRRPKLVATVFTLAAGMGVTMAVTMPRTYHSQVKLLAQANLVVPALSNPDRAVPRDADSPTKNVADQILRRDNLIALAKETNLVERSFATRSPLTKLKDAVLGGGDATDDEKLAGIAEILEKKFSITIQNNNVIIGVDWNDPHVAYELVTLVQKNFLSARYDDEVAMVSDAIAVLQEHEKVEAAGVDTALAEYKKLSDKPSGSTAATSVPHGPPAPRALRPAASSLTAAQTVPTIDPDVAAALEEKRQQIRSLESGRQRELETLRAQLAQAQLTLTPQHPTVIALQQKVDSLSAPDPQLVQLRAEERALMTRIAPPLAAPGANSSAPPAAPLPAPVGPPAIPVLPAPHPLAPGEDPQTQLARSKLEGAIRRDQEAVARIEAANMELEVARTAFKYRYTVVTPAEVPRGPKKPVAPLVGVASVIGAALLALLLAAGADQRSGRILEEWQVERRLKLEVLGEFDPSMHVPTRPL